MLRNKEIYEIYLKVVNETLSYFRIEDSIFTKKKYKVTLTRKDMDEGPNTLKSKKKIKRFKTNFRVENLTKAHKNFLEILCAPMDLSEELDENLPFLVDFQFEDLLKFFQKIDVENPDLKMLYKEYVFTCIEFFEVKINRNADFLVERAKLEDNLDERFYDLACFLDICIFVITHKKYSDSDKLRLLSSLQKLKCYQR